ncbi:MAG: hypothetical protein EZS28_018409 [Streblomastix strix]|uniref:Uncharacterized protein n=1 Tax=Streblomastix strix TaxID=222440 RepID=A0A5J4VTR2_9EUKA|nr:MAG: hypothetical protein EZS28_018409 [Streblomastix strix]
MTELSITSTNSNTPYAYILGQAVVDENQFQCEVYSRVLVTCRSGFYPSMTGLTSDSGFGSQCAPAPCSQKKRFSMFFYAEVSYLIENISPIVQNASG